MPGFGDIPVLGQLFNSQEFVSGETELVILVTPRLATPIDRERVTLPTDAFVTPNDFEYYLLGRGAYLDLPQSESIQRQEEDSVVIQVDGGSEGVFGHDL